MTNNNDATAESHDFIKLFQTRDFSEKFTTTFTFISKVSRPLLVMSLYLLLPLCVVEAIGGDSYFDDVWSAFTAAAHGGVVDEDYTPPLWSYTLLMVGSLLSLVVAQALAYGLMKEYDDRGGNIEGLTMKAFMPRLGHSLKRAFRALGVSVIVTMVFVMACVILGLSYFISPWLLILAIIAMVAGGVVFFIPLSLFPAAYLLDDDLSVGQALRTSLRYGFKTWGGLFATIFVFGIIYNMVSSVATVPAIVVGIVKAEVFPGAAAGGASLLAYNFATFVLMLLASFVSALLSMVLFIAIGYHYGHAAELIDSRSVSDDIDRFDELADNNEDPIDDAFTATTDD